jgi:hypothetical protein
LKSLILEGVSMTFHEMLAAAGVGGVAGAVGTLASTVLKDLLIPRHLEQWRSRRELARVFRKYKDPILLSSTELFYRIDELFVTDLNYLGRNSAAESSGIHRSPAFGESFYDSSFYRQYKFESTLYWFCAFLGWLELYRVEGRFVNVEREHLALGLDAKIDRIQSFLADRKLNATQNWNDWNDRVIFREEQRAIGQMMLTIAFDKGPSVLGYKDFCDTVLPAKPRWVQIVESFFDGIQSTLQNDFRLIRIRGLCILLIDVIRDLHALASDSPLLGRRREHVEFLRRHVSEHRNPALFLYRPNDLNLVEP